MSLPKDNKPSPTVIEGINDEPNHKEIRWMGRDITQIPCFKESFLYGLLGGIGCGLATFTATSRVGKATNIAVYSFTGIVFIYYFNCRHTLSKSRFTIAQTEAHLRNRGNATIDDNN